MEELQDRLGYHFNSTPLLEEALHPAGTRPLQGNKRLALLGDSVLSTSLLDKWYDSEDTIGTLNCELASLVMNFDQTQKMGITHCERMRVTNI
jgi:dsRNA-specific ribonuclease